MKSSVISLYKRISLVFSAFVASFLSHFCFAFEVPVDLPNEAAIDAYEVYLQRAHYSAFAVSREGAYGSSWSYGIVSAAELAAIEDCQQTTPSSPCFVVSIDGKSLQETVDPETLVKRLEEQRQVQWPQVKKGAVPIQIAANPEQIANYQEYLLLTGHKAFVASRDGAWGMGWQKSNDEQAVKAAIDDCHSKTTNPRGCSVIDQNHQATLGRVAVRLPDTQEDTPIALPDILQSDLASKQKAIPLFKNRWQEYQDAERHKAFAINNFGASGMAKEHASALVAEEAALSSCEAYNAIRRNSPIHFDKVAPCFIVATNNFYDVDNIDRVAAQKLVSDTSE